jgi:tetratricopeptide (TPR) repeat protein
MVAGVPAERIKELMDSAIAMVPRGEWARAAGALEQAAALHREAGRDNDEARCLQFAATLRRTAGDTEGARPLLERAATIAPERLSVSIAAERAEAAFGDGRFEDAWRDYTAALEQGREALTAEGRSAVLRRRAAAAMALGRVEEAGADLLEVCALLERARGKEAAMFARLEHAGLLWRHGHADESARVLGAVETLNPHVAAEALVLRARMARETGDLDAALEQAERARAAALEAIAPVSYFEAAAELAETLRLRGDFAAAYGVMAAAWGTLSDVIGAEAARSWVEPVLAAYRLGWGDEEFRRAKSAYEDARRQRSAT